MAQLKFYRDGKKEIRWRITSKGRVLDASTEGFKRLSGAVNNLRATGKRITQILELWQRDKRGKEIDRALRQFKSE
jgi:hypothetical protein